MELRVGYAWEVGTREEDMDERKEEATQAWAWRSLRERTRRKPRIQRRKGERSGVFRCPEVYYTISTRPILQIPKVRTVTK